MTHCARKKLLTEFSYFTSAHGFADISRSGLYWRILWMVLLSVSWFVCGWQIYETVIDFTKFPTTTTVKLEYMHDAEFPAVSICNVNPLRQSRVVEMDNTQSLGIRQQTMLSIQQIQEIDTTWDAHLGLSSQVQDSRALLSRWLRSIVYKYKIDLSENGHQLNEMLLECNYQGYECSPNDFVQWEHALYGNCYTIRVDKKQFRTFNGPEYGLQIGLYTESDEYLPFLSDSVGFRVNIHSQNYVSFPDDLGFTISPGLATSIGIRQVIIERQAMPYDNTDCATKVNYTTYQYWDSMMNIHQNYSATACFKSCMHRTVVEKCGCVDTSSITRIEASTLSVDDVKACETTDVPCIANATKQAFLCTSSCPSACYEEQYHTRATSSMWPSQEYFAGMMPSWSKRSPKFCEALSTQMREDKMIDIDCFMLFGELIRPSNDVPPTSVTVPNLDSPITTTMRNPRSSLSSLFQSSSGTLSTITGPNDSSTADSTNSASTLPMSSTNSSTTTMAGSRRKRQAPTHINKEFLSLLSQTTSQARGIVAKLHVFYEEMNHELIIETPTYTWTSLLSSLGGTLGLYSGLSLLGIFQFIELLLRMLHPVEQHRIAGPPPIGDIY